LYNALDSLHATAAAQIEGSVSEVHSLGSLEIALLEAYPAIRIEHIRPILNQLEEIDIDEAVLKKYLETAYSREKAANAARKLLDVAEGTAAVGEIQTVLADLTETSATIEVVPDFVENDLNAIILSQSSSKSLSWRLGSLNRSVGPLGKGDFGFVFARPETGKTTFLVSEVTFMASNADAPVLWFNNEEENNKVLLRAYQAVFGLDSLTILNDPDKYNRKFTEITKNNFKLVHDVSITKQRVEALCKKYQPSLIVLDQIDAIKGFQHDDRNDIELKNIYVWARQIAKTYAPVIAVCQAGASGEGKKYLTMNDVDNSKTGKQSAADWILGIGKTHDDGLEAVRYMHLSKNKSMMTREKDPALRHGKWEVKIQPEIARYEDFE